MSTHETVTGIAPLDSDAEADLARIGAAWRELRRGGAMLALRRGLHALDDGTVLELGQVDALQVLVNEGDLRMAELADRLRVDASTATRAAQRLVEAGFAERRAHEDDRRGVVLAITSEGRAIQQRFAERGRALHRQLAPAFAPGELADLAELMTRLVDAIDRLVDDDRSL